MFRPENTQIQGIIIIIILKKKKKTQLTEHCDECKMHFIYERRTDRPIKYKYLIKKKKKS